MPAAPPACLERIRALDPSIQAWVRVNLEAATGGGALDRIPFGVKDRGHARAARRHSREQYHL
jgi:hypothetical protein